MQVCGLTQLLAAVVLLRTVVAAPVNSSATGGVDLCGRPSPDPCVPGGKWDPLLQKCQGLHGADCYQCYSGPNCQNATDHKDCKLDITAGDPVVLSEYWTEYSAEIPCLQTPSDYRPAYQHQLIPLLEPAILKLHDTVGNVETDGYTLVYGLGATEVIFLAISVISQNIITECIDAKRQDCPSQVDVFVQTPFYFGYSSIVEAIATANWNPQANTSSEFTIEVVTHPNNPDGKLRQPEVQNRSHVIFDMVYYWPMFTNDTVKMAEDIMVFSASKHDGLAGTRFGWGFVKDAQVASKMQRLASDITLALPEDAMLRTYNSISTILSQGVSPDFGMLYFHWFGRTKVYTAIDEISKAIADCKALAITLNNDLNTPGAYAWLHCDACVECNEQLKALGNFEGIPGTYFGTTNDWVRFSMLGPTAVTDLLIKKFTDLCK